MSAPECRMHPGCADPGCPWRAPEPAVAGETLTEAESRAVDLVSTVFGWQHLARYSGKSQEWLNTTLVAIVRAAREPAAQRAARTTGLPANHPLRCASCGVRATTTVILEGFRTPVCLRHYNVWKTPMFDDAYQRADLTARLADPDVIEAAMRAHSGCGIMNVDDSEPVTLTCGLTVPRPSPDSTTGWVDLHRAHVAAAVRDALTDGAT